MLNLRIDVQGAFKSKKLQNKCLPCIKGYGSVDVGLIEQFELIEKLNPSHKAKYSTKLLCDVFDVHHSSYKCWHLGDTSLRADDVIAGIMHQWSDFSEI
ncbi:hypothetical protein [Thalassotalea atypica]|uniref:hypothetical protein n=1 Tax=Thalassotalea atypica TaxID=2054316 RepID=UPI002573FCC8|nr:hypothetical protein [Thalassotalea atypica]